jgi:hypothetical protein
VATSQLAIPQDACNQAYGAYGYARSVTNLAPLALESDMVFADGTALQLAPARHRNRQRRRRLRPAPVDGRVGM